MKTMKAEKGLLEWQNERKKGHNILELHSMEANMLLQHDTQNDQISPLKNL